MDKQCPLYCPYHHRRIGHVPLPVLWTGVVDHIPEDTEDSAGLLFFPCESCRKSRQPHWHRYEIIPPDPDIKIFVPTGARELKRSA